MNAELCKLAVTKVRDPNFLVNIISRRVRQLTTPGAPGGRPLLADTTHMGAADIALAELVEDKMSWEILDQPKEKEAPTRKRKKH